jgi:hypothetical protein
LFEMEKVNSNMPNRSSASEEVNKIKEIAIHLIDNEILKISQIANYLKIGKQQQSSFYKFIKGGFSCPKSIAAQAKQILVTMTQLLDDPDLAIRKESVKREVSKDEILPSIHTVFIPFNLKMPVVSCYNPNTPVPFIQTGNPKGIVLYNNSSRYDADGDIYMAQIGMATDIDPGTRFSIKRINKHEWHPDRYYVVIESSYQIGIHELIPGDDEKTVRLVSPNSPEGPHRILHLEKILALFKIVNANCIPKPKRNISKPPIDYENNQK